MVKKRVYIILLVILAVFLLVMFLAFGRKNLKQEAVREILIIGDSTENGIK